jgi:hypothetical protein
MPVNVTLWGIAILFVMSIQFTLVATAQLKLAAAIQRIAVSSNCQAPASIPTRPLVTQP